MSAEAVTILFSISALFVTCLFVGKVLKLILKVAAVVGIIYLGWRYQTEIQGAVSSLLNSISS